MTLLLALTVGCSDYNFHDGIDATAGATTPVSTTETTAGRPPGDCSDFQPPVAWDAQVDESCLNEPSVGTWTPVVEWQWRSNPIHPGYDDVMAAPSIANLSDDDGDGDVDRDDVPDIVFAAFAGGAYTSAGAIVAISGDGSRTLWSTVSAGGHSLYSSSQIAIGDLDADGLPEVCVSGLTASVVCLDHLGAFKWAGGTEPYGYGAPAIADLDQDGLAEVVHGRTVLNHDGSLRFHAASGAGYFFSFPLDWDGDGQLEIVTGSTIYRNDGTVLWESGHYDGYPAAADFDLDGRPDHVRVSAGQVELHGNDGALRWTSTLPGGGSGGPPTIADFDGDGYPEVGVAALAYYTVFDTNGAVLWSNPVSDYSSSQTGSSVFDFEGDGASEVVYADEHTLWVFDGATGLVELAEGEHSSGTLMEYPLVADVDHDDSTEIVVPCNDYAYTGCNGIKVFGDANGSWMPARPVWNQHAYHITNIGNDGAVPASQQPNWLTWNNFRAGGTELGPTHWNADLAPGDPALCFSECADQEVTLYLSLDNTGLLDGKDFLVALVPVGSAVPVYVEEVPILASGDSAVLGPITLHKSDWADHDLAVWIDWADDIPECDEADNVGAVGTWPCP